MAKVGVVRRLGGNADRVVDGAACGVVDAVASRTHSKVCGGRRATHLSGLGVGELS